MLTLPFISIIIPCRNEENFIGKCLESIVANDYPKDKLEVLVVDGMSNDKTREILKNYINNYRFIRLIDNQNKIVPKALNIGIKKSNGELIILMGAHNVYEKDYINKCIKYLQKYNVDIIGGIFFTLSGRNTSLAKSIALALSHPFGVGNTYFRIGSKNSRYVDTVPFGCYKHEVFDKIGLFDENLVRNQDLELNLRLKRAGGKILLMPDIVSYYHARSDLKGLFKQNFWNGFWVIYSAKFAKMPCSLRHLVPFAFVFSLLISFSLYFLYKPFIYLFAFIISIYLIANIFFSFLVSLKSGFKYFPFLVLSFLTLHFSYGLGSLRGLIKLIMNMHYLKEKSLNM